MISMVLFDFDGTLADSIGYIKLVLNQMAPNYGLEPLSDEEFDKFRSKSIPQALKELKISFLTMSRAIPLVLSEYRHHVKDLLPFAGIPAMLKDLQELGCKMAMLSSNHVDNLEFFVHQHNLNYFEWIEGTSGILKKQHSLRKLMKRHALKAENLIYVGDETRDIVAAKKCGIRVIAVSWGFQTVDLLAAKNPDYLVEKPQEIVEILKLLCQPA